MKKMMTSMAHKNEKLEACPKLVSMETENIPPQPQPMIFVRQKKNINILPCLIILL